MVGKSNSFLGDAIQRKGQETRSFLAKGTATSDERQPMIRDETTRKIKRKISGINTLEVRYNWSIGTQTPYRCQFTNFNSISYCAEDVCYRLRVCKYLLISDILHYKITDKCSSRRYLAITIITGEFASRDKKLHRSETI